MKRIVLYLLILFLMPFAIAESDYTVNGYAMTELGIEELYKLEDALISALEEAFFRESSGTPDGDVIGTYVVNTKTGKFHYPYCYSAIQIGPKNRRFEICAASELIEQGLDSCGQCKPYHEE